ncbi:MAG TPA: alpha-E domain-containing protein, partial [Tepidisphaeraceae bacterium]|nr:alpha-E domain-containing protein [Tepidisphaeraceae bacterium]
MQPSLDTDKSLRRRALLARVADSLFWMSRNVERAEHVARGLRITTNIMMDMGDLSADLQAGQWKNLLGLVGMPMPEGLTSARERVARFMALDPLCPGSLVSCINNARENARAVRSEISAEMWETINTTFWWIRSDEARQRFEEQPEEFYLGIINFSMRFQGQTDQTLPHGQRWMFIQLAKSFERIDMTCRIVQARLDAYEEIEDALEASLRTIQWMTTVRMCCAIEAYRRKFSADFNPIKVADFLVLEPTFPRSVRYNVDAALHAITSIRRITSPDTLDPAERVLGRLQAQLEYASAQEIADVGVWDYLENIQNQVMEAGVLVQKTY